MQEEKKLEEVKDTLNESIKQVKEKIEAVNKNKLQQGNIDFLYKLVDVYKDILDIQEKEENMRYSNYGNFDNYSGNNYGRRMIGRGHYSESGSYGRRGYDAKYRGEDMLNEMNEAYGEYMESGNYGGEETTKALKYMLKSAEDFFRHIQDEAKSPEEIEMVKNTARRISEM